MSIVGDWVHRKLGPWDYYWSTLKTHIGCDTKSDGGSWNWQLWRPYRRSKKIGTSNSSPSQAIASICATIKRLSIYAEKCQSEYARKWYCSKQEEAKKYLQNDKACTPPNAAAQPENALPRPWRHQNTLLEWIIRTLLSSHQVRDGLWCKRKMCEKHW